MYLYPPKPIDYQPLDAGLTSLAALTYSADAFVKMTGANIFTLRTIAQTKTDLSLNLVENTTLSTWVGSGNITTLGTIASGIWQGTSIAVGYTDAKCTDATADNTAANQTSHADVLIDGDFGSNGLMERTGAGSYGIKVIGTDVQAYHANLAAIAASTWTGAASITTLGTIATGTWQSTDVGIAYGGTGQSTAQLAINALSAVSGATNEHVLTKDTVTGNAIFKAAAGGGHTFVDRGDPSAWDFATATNLTADDTWRDLDLSGIIDAGTIAVLMRGYMLDDATAKSLQLREKGNSNTINVLRIYGQTANVSRTFSGFVACDANRKLEYKITTGMDDARLVVAGWLV